MNLNKLYDCIQVEYSTRKHSTKNEYFPMPILFTIIYLLYEQKLNLRNHSKQEIIMMIFVWTTDYDINMHAKSQGMAGIDIRK
jgi:hypothetical protein